jgi:hypothetical protein
MSGKLINRLAIYDTFLIARCFLFAIGCISLWWGVAGLSVFGQQFSIERIANRVIAGEQFNATLLGRQFPIIDGIERATWCRPAALRSAAIIRLRVVEVTASTGDHKRGDEDLQSLDNAIRSSLSCSPADPFLWLGLYWVESTRNGIKPEYFNYLRMSYQLGPNEGWIIFKRNPIAFANFALLPNDVAAGAINEFMALIKSELYQQAVEMLSGPAWHVRDRILPQLATLPRENREGFARFASAKGLTIVIPGVDPPKSRPWQ